MPILRAVKQPHQLLLTVHLVATGKYKPHAGYE